MGVISIYKILLTPFNTTISFGSIFRRFLFCLFVCQFSMEAQTVKLSDLGHNNIDNKSILFKALKGNDTIVVDGKFKEWIFSPIVLRNHSNKTILIDSNVVLKAKKNAFLKNSDCLFRIVNSKNIHLIGNHSRLVMNKKEYTTGEWRMGISIVGSSNISIKNLTIEGSGGDGIYIDGNKTKTFSNNILIENVVSRNNKRQGISIISAKDVIVRDSKFSHTKGTLPEAGLDIEPDSYKDIIQNIYFENCAFTNNNHSGIVLGLDNLNNESEPVSIYFKDCFLSMNHVKENRYPAAELMISSNSESAVKGEVVFENLTVNRSEWRFLYSRKLSSGYHVYFNGLNVSDICQSNLESSAIYLEVPDYYKSSGPIGGFTFKNSFFKFQSKSSVLTIKGSSLRTLVAAKNINGSITVTNPNLSGYIEYIKYSKLKNIDFDLRFTRIEK